MINPTKKARVVLYGGIALFLIFALIPYYWVLRTSFLTSLATISAGSPIVPLPTSEDFTLGNYFAVWDVYPMVRYFGNSLFISFGSTIVALLVSIPGAYAFARLEFPGKTLLFYTAVFTVMIPSIVLLIPVYELFYWLNWIDSYFGLIMGLGIFVMPLSIWLLQGFFQQGVPPNIEEAAKMDGLTEITAFIRIVLPLSAPAVAVAALFAFLNAWNNFLWVYLITNSEAKRTATVAIYYLTASDSLRQWNLIMAVMVLLVLPPIIFYGLAQGEIGEGLG